MQVRVALAILLDFAFVTPGFDGTRDSGALTFLKFSYFTLCVT
jgi:hypothetical protein